MATDLNITSETVYTGLSPLTLEDIRKFCNTYIKPFAPYCEEKVYNALINNLTEYYYNQTYLKIPYQLKQIYEESNFDEPIYDQLLIGIGVPTEIINKLSSPNKLIFLKTLSDFKRYSGSLSFFQKVGESFADRLNIYELFIDFDGTNWVFKPVAIYVHDQVDLNLDPLPYNTVRTAIPSFLISEEQLTTLYNEEKIILPIKSNLLMIYNVMVNDVFVLYDMIVAVFLHTYKENFINIYFTDRVQTLNLKTIYFLWFYILSRYYGTTWTTTASAGLVRFLYDDIGFPTHIGKTPLTIANLSTIIKRYDDIKITNANNRDSDNSQSLRDSLYKDISTAFYTTIDKSSTVTVSDMYDELVIINPSLISYIDNRIVNTSIGEKAEINIILTEIYSSLILYSSTYSGDRYFKQYADYFLRQLPQILINPENTPTYTILSNLKPYHVELFSVYNSDIKVHNKFNQIFIDDETGLSFFQRLVTASALSFSDDCPSDVKFSSMSEVLCADGCIPDIKIHNIDQIFIDDETGLSFFQRLVTASALSFSDDCPSNFGSSLMSEVLCTDGCIPDIKIHNVDQIFIDGETGLSFFQRLVTASELSFSDDCPSNFGSSLMSEVLCTDECIVV